MKVKSQKFSELDMVVVKLLLQTDHYEVETSKDEHLPPNGAGGSRLKVIIIFHLTGYLLISDLSIS